MTTPATTDRDIRSKFEVEETAPDNGKASRVARGKLMLTHRSVEFQGAARRWWLLTSRPMSIRAAWRLSRGVDPTRIPTRGRLLQELWRWDNRIGTRPLLFLLAMAAPTCLTGPILWCAVRPARRAGTLAAVLILCAGIAAAGAR